MSVPPTRKHLFGWGWQLNTTAAGHPLPIVATAGGTDTTGRSLIGVHDAVTTTTAEIELNAGDVVVFYTDGITDLPPPCGIDASELAEVIHKLRDLPTAEDVAAGIHKALLDRVPGHRRRDDVAVLIIRVR